MPRRSYVAGLLLLLSLSACEQAPDVVLRTSMIDGAAGQAGMSGMGGGAGEGAGGTCDQALIATSDIFWRIRYMDNCRFDWSNEQVRRLLELHIFEQPPVMLTPEALAADMACNFFRTLNVQNWHYEGWRPDVDLTKRVICPEYCAALQEWLDDHEDVAANCLPADGS